MTPITQTIIDKSKGNCFSAALASILDLPLESIPYFRIMDQDNWISALFSFLDLKGYEYRGSKYGTDVLKYDLGVNGYYIVNGRSRTYVDDPTAKHSVVFYKGAMVHDPNPSGKGLYTIEYCYMIEPKREICDL